jgi:imidazolonepropionase-like amidohydrolase
MSLVRPYHRLLPAIVAALLLVPLAVQAQGVDAPPGTFVFVNVSVLPMDGGPDVLENQTVLVEGDRITAMGPAGTVRVPQGATVIDGGGRYLMPGLAEMHAHVPPVAQGRPSEGVLEDIMFLYVANGITTIRGMLGSPYQIELRDELLAHEMLGPAFYAAAPSINGNSAPTPEAAEAMMRAAAELGYDLMKIHPGVSRETWDRMVDVADEVGLTFGGHVPADVGLVHALETGISTVDHMDGYLEAAAGGAPTSVDEMVAGLDERRMRRLARMTRDRGAYVVPTQYLWANLYGSPDAEAMLRLPEMNYVSPQQRQGWRNQAAGTPRLDSATREAFLEARDRMLRILGEEDVLLLMGTDSPQLFNVPGFALHRELDAMSAAGLDNRTILVSGTRNVGRYVEEELEQDGSFGTVAPGQRADLVLLEANPLDDLDHLTRRAGVMVRGRWLDREFLDAGLRAIAAKYPSVS